MKLSDALDELHTNSFTAVSIPNKDFMVYEQTAKIFTTKVANRLTVQRTFLIGLLAGAVGYGLTLTWVASELVHENQTLTFELNATQTALHIAKSPYFIQHSKYCSDSWGIL